MIPVNPDKTASQGLTIIHYGVGALFFFLMTVMIWFSLDAFNGHYFHPKLLAITHIAVLGWGVMIIFGALYQFLPVITDAVLFNIRFAVVSFILLCSGTLFLACSFWFFKVGAEMQIAGILIFSSFLLFSINVNLTLRKAKRWSMSADFIQASSIWLIITALIGLLMVFNFRFPFLPESHLVYLKVHAHAGIIGWFLLLIIGVASKLLPMFLLSHPLSEAKLRITYWCINIGLLGYILDHLIFDLRIALVHLTLVLIGIAFFISFCYKMIRSRMRKAFDWPMKQSIFALLLLILPLILAFFQISWQSVKEDEILRISLAYGISIFIGFITALILGQTFKTLPFIVWMYAYKNQNLPTKLLPRDLYSEKLVAIMQFVYLPGLISLMLGVLLQNAIVLKVGAGLLLLTAMIYCFNVGIVLFHILKPKENGVNYQLT